MEVAAPQTEKGVACLGRRWAISANKKFELLRAESLREGKSTTLQHDGRN
jgi:hypothetical protein